MRRLSPRRLHQESIDSAAARTRIGSVAAFLASLSRRAIEPTSRRVSNLRLPCARLTRDTLASSLPLRLAPNRPTKAARRISRTDDGLQPLLLLRHGPGQYVGSGGPDRRLREHEAAPGGLRRGTEIGRGHVRQGRLDDAQERQQNLRDEGHEEAHVHLRQQRGLPGARAVVVTEGGQDPAEARREEAVLAAGGGHRDAARLLRADGRLRWRRADEAFGAVRPIRRAGRESLLRAFLWGCRPLPREPDQPPRHQAREPARDL